MPHSLTSDFPILHEKVAASRTDFESIQISSWSQRQALRVHFQCIGMVRARVLCYVVLLLMCCSFLIPQDGVNTGFDDISKRPSKKRYDMQLRLAEFVKNGHQFKGGFCDVALNK